VGGLFTNLFGWVVDKFGVWLSNKSGKIKEANVLYLIWQEKWRNQGSK
jgi:hypothetical protein